MHSVHLISCDMFHQVFLLPLNNCSSLLIAQCHLYQKEPVASNCQGNIRFIWFANHYCFSPNLNITVPHGKRPPAHIIVSAEIKAKKTELIALRHKNMAVQWQRLFRLRPQPQPLTMVDTTCQHWEHSFFLSMLTFSLLLSSSGSSSSLFFSSIQTFKCGLAGLAGRSCIPPLH